MHVRRTVAAVLVVALSGAYAPAQTQAPEEKSFKTADGVKLRGLFYKSPKGGSAPVVLMLHAYKANPDEAVWADTAKMLVGQGYNVLRFDFRGHGKSTDVDPAEFFDVRQPWGPINKANVKIGPGLSPATKNTIKYVDFSPNYFPMLVQDLAAARNLIDQMNDTGELNASSIYLLGAGEAAPLGLFFVATEWLRERSKPNVPVPPQFVSPRRQLFPGSDPAGMDYAGAIWLGPAKAPALVPTELRNWVVSAFALKMRTETPMLFLYGEKDKAAEAVAKAFYDSVLMVDAKAGPSGAKLPRPEQTFRREIKGSGNAGVKLLGNNLGTEKMIEDFLREVEKERKGKTRKVRDWEKPLYIDVGSGGFGAIR
jgi:pimeloyl-ACP methyl ester carboxylesterase